MQVLLFNEFQNLARPLLKLSDASRIVWFKKCSLEFNRVSSVSLPFPIHASCNFHHRPSNRMQVLGHGNRFGDPKLHSR
ncbi:hypothetical protein RDI58_023793 [Solanum bulbocastanum]|uniref:Uncharacterized protein n=1 Tax=Solanum bulbocastanum TaxID=147425 RepID=A0AAN8T1T3_SOLBU